LSELKGIKGVGAFGDFRWKLVGGGICQGQGLDGFKRRDPKRRSHRCRPSGSEGDSDGWKVYFVLYQLKCIKGGEPERRVQRGSNAAHVGRALREFSLPKGEHNFDAAKTTAEQMGGWTYLDGLRCC
jgi:hypothetical protein